MMFSRRRGSPIVQESQLSSLVAEDVVVTGDIHFTGGMRIDGKVTGNVIGQPGESQAPVLLVLSSKASVKGTVQCGNAVVDGEIDGELIVEHFVELQSNARVTGTVRYRCLQVDQGAKVQAQFIHLGEAVGPDNVISLSSEKTATAG